jgi:lipopolysaccharide export system protein LptC
MRWIIILLIALGLSALAVYKNQERPAIRDIVATTTPETLTSYQDDIIGFNVTYQQQYQMKTENFEGYLPLTATPVVAFQIPANLYTGTNLGEAGVYIGASSSPKILATCLKATKDMGATSMGTTTINGQVWNVFTSADAGAGNLYESKTYRIIHNKQCFEMNELLHSGNINNYPEGEVVEFDKPKFQTMLDEVAQTFTFTK